MAVAKVPLVPQWNIANGCVSTPDGGFLYVGSKSINYIGNIRDEAPLIKVFHTRQSILSVDVDPGWAATSPSLDGDKAQRYFAALAQDNSVQIWDFHRGQVVRGHKAHLNTKQRRYMEGNGPSPAMVQGERVLLGYMRNHNVLSVDARDLVIYCVASNTYCQRPMFVSSRNQQMMVMRCSPYNENIFAVGTSRGLVLVCDMQRMCILYSLRGHDSAVTGLSWNCVYPDVDILPAAITLKPPSPPSPTPPAPPAQNERAVEVPREREENKKTTKSKKLKAQPAAGAASDDIFDIYDYDYLENEFGAPSHESNPASTKESVKKYESDENEFVGIERPKELEGASVKFDFAEACQSLKEDIASLKQQETDPTPATQQCDVVTLADCQKAGRHDSTSCGEDDESSEGSLELIDRSSSSDELDVDGVERKHKQQVLLHQAEVHASQNSEKDMELKKIEEPVVPLVVPEDQRKPQKEQEIEQLKEAEADPVPVQNTVKDVLLLSGAVDGSIWVWNTESGGACDNFRTRTNSKAGKNTNIEVGWLNATTFLATTRLGDLTMYSVDSQANLQFAKSSMIRRYKFKEQKQLFTQRGVVSFSIQRESSLLWCISLHRQIWCEDMGQSKIIANYCCASSNISAMRECPDNMNKIALGFSDRRIGIIDTTKLSPTSVNIENYSSKVDAAVLALVWSPDNKKLAFGTIEGRVGVVNVENPKKPTSVFIPVCGKPIYSMDWQGNYIYVVCNEMVCVYDANASNKDAHVIAQIKNASNLSVRENYLFIGTQRGHLEVYRRPPNDPASLSYEFVQNLEITFRYITDIAWSPIAKDMVAVVANDNKIQVLRFDMASGVLTPQYKTELLNAKAAHSCVKWSNRNENEFLTCGFDGALRVWTLKDGNIVEKFVKQFHCPVACGLFLPANEEVIVCGGRSTSIEFIDMQAELSDQQKQLQQQQHPQQSAKRSSALLENVHWAQKIVSRADSKVLSAAEKRRNRRQNMSEQKDVEESKHIVLASGDGKENTDITNLVQALNISENQSKCQQQRFEESQRSATKCDKQCGSIYMKNPVTLLYLTTKELNKDALEKLTHILSTANWNCNQKQNKVLLSKLFAKKSIVQELLAEELNNYIHSETKGISTLIMPQLNGNIKEEIIKSIQEKQLTEWHVSLAPAISYNFWQKCCQAFAEQLLEQGCALQAATYMIAVHNPTGAIEMLLSKYYYKEALIIARVYLQPDDPLVATIVDKWITYLDFTGNLLGAVLICTISGRVNRAYDLLGRIRSTETESLMRLLKSKTNEKLH